MKGWVLLRKTKAGRELVVLILKPIGTLGR
jgi:hypothetical protein